MRKYLLYLTLTFVVAAFITGCKKDDDIAKATTESKVVQGSIMGVNGPTSGLVDQELTFNLVWQNDGTLKFHHLLDSVSNDTTMVRIFTLTNIVDTSAAAKMLSTASYKFKAAKAGTYYLKFFKADSTGKAVIIDTLSIK